METHSAFCGYSSTWRFGGGREADERRKVCHELWPRPLKLAIHTSILAHVQHGRIQLAPLSADWFNLVPSYPPISTLSFDKLSKIPQILSSSTERVFTMSPTTTDIAVLRTLERSDNLLPFPELPS